MRQVFTDDLTGKRADRPGLSSLISFLQSDRKNPHVVIIDDLSRMARRVPVHFELREAIAQAGGILESPSVELRDDADGELHEYILASVSQHQSRKNAEQTMNRMQARCMNGYWVFQPPIGYKYDKFKGHGKLLVRNEPLATIVQEALEGYASGRFETQVEVKRFFEGQPDFPKDFSNGLIRNQRINDILNRPVYAGYIEVPNWNISLRDGQHGGLITLETHQKIQDRLKLGAKAPARKDINKDFPLRRFILCGDCEKPLTANWSKSKTGKKHPYYLCFSKGCDSYRKSIRREFLEGKFAELVQSLRPTQNLFSIAKTMLMVIWDHRMAQAEDIRRSLKNEIVKLDNQIEQLVDRIVESSSPTAIGAYEQRIAKLEKQKLIADGKLHQNNTPKRSFDEMFELAGVFLQNPWKLWASGQIHLRKTVLRLAFTDRIAYTRNQGFSNAKKSLPFNILGGHDMMKCEMARSGRFELPTP